MLDAIYVDVHAIYLYSRVDLEVTMTNSAKPIWEAQNQELMTHCNCQNMAHSLYYITTNCYATTKVPTARLCDFHMNVVCLITDPFMERCDLPSTHSFQYCAIKVPMPQASPANSYSSLTGTINGDVSGHIHQ